jgi:hypothetical protein
MGKYQRSLATFKNRGVYEKTDFPSEAPMIRHAVLGLVLLISTVALGLAQEKVRADIPFSFIAGTKTLPAGTYTFQDAEQGTAMLVRSVKTGEANAVGVLSRLGPRSTRESEVVFDVVGNDHYLAEVHMESTDGYAFRAAPGKHTHVGVKASR